MNDFKIQNSKFKIAVASGKGGVGKSMVASSLAILFSCEQKLVVVDADVDAPNLHLWLGVGRKAAKGKKLSFKDRSQSLALGNLAAWDSVETLSTNQRPFIDQETCTLCGKCMDICQFDALSFDEVASFSSRSDGERGLKSAIVLNSYFCEGCGACAEVCPEGAIKMEPVNNAEMRIKEETKYGFPLVSGQLKPGETGSGKIVDEIKTRAEQYDYEILLVDVPAGTGCPVISALKDVDFAVLVTEPTPSGLSDLRRVLEVVNHFEFPFGVVINKWDINTDLSTQIEAEFEGKILGKISYDRSVFKAISNLIPVLETDLDIVGELSDIFKELSKSLM